LANKFAMDPEAGISTEPVVGGIDYDEMDLKYVMGTPQMTSQYAFVSGSSDIAVASTSPFALSSPYTYVDFVVRNFRFCSGSYKFKCYITASMMHSVRLAFYIATVVSDWQDCYHKLVDVQGDTEVEFTLPYCPGDVIRETDTETVYWQVFVNVVSFSQPTPGVSNPIYINVYKAAASDFKVGCMVETSFIPSLSGAPAGFMAPVPHDIVETHSNPRKDFSKVFEPFHPSMVGYSPDNIIYPEEYTTVRECVHRQHPYGVAVTNVPIPIWQTSTFASSGFQLGKEIWGLLYMYWRGSIRVQYLRRSDNHIPMTASFQAGMFNETHIPGLDLTNTNKPILEGEIPWYAKELFQPTSLAPTNVISTNVVSASNSSYYCSSMGDDASFHFLRPVPIGTLSTIEGSSNYSYPGVTAFYSSL